MPSIKRTHPGEVLRVEFMTPLGLTTSRLAGEIGATEAEITALIEERAPVTESMADKLSARFGTSADFWINLQNNHNAAEDREWLDMPDVGREKVEE